MYPRRLDLGCAAFVGLTAVGSLAMPRDSVLEREVDWVVLLLTGALAVAVGLTRRWPVPASALVLAALLVYTWRGYPGGPLLFAGPLWLFLLGLVWPWRATALAGAGLVVALGGGLVLSGQPITPDRPALALSLAVVAVLGAEVVKGRLDAARQRRVRQRLAEDQARATERLRIAQDLHDSLGHALSLIAIQSRLARRQVGDGPGAAPLQVLTDTTTRAIADLGGLLHAMRAEGQPHRPVGSVEQLPELIDEAAAAGQHVEADLDTDVSLPVAQATALYRVAQESLTNARRHAPERPVTLRLWRHDGRVRLLVRNPRVPGAPAHAGSGLGLVGMRERVETTGGRVEAGLVPGGDWQVLASWPS